MKTIRKISRREFLRLTSLAAAGTVLASCAPQATTAPTAMPTTIPTPTVPKPVTLTVSSHNYQPFVDWLNKDFGEFMQQNPYITVKYNTYPDVDYPTVTLTQLQANTAPDMMYMMASLPALAAKGYIAAAPSDIEGVVKSKCTPITHEMGLYNGKFYGMANTIGCRLAIWNPDLLDKNGVTKIPETWDEIAAMNEKLLVKNGSVVVQAGCQLGWDPYVEWFPPMLWDYGANLWNSDGTGLALEEPQAITVAKLWQDNTHPDLGYYGDAFSKKAVAMCATGSWAKQMFQTNAPDIKLTSTLMPGGPKGRFMATTGTGWVVNAASAPEVQDAAWKLLDYIILRPQAQVEWLDVGFLPTLVDGLNSDAVQKDAWLKPFADASLIAKLATPTGCVGWTNVDPIIQDEITKLGTGDLTPEQFVKDLRDKGTAALQKQGCTA